MATERVRKNVLPELKRMIEAGRGAEEVTFRQQITSYAFSHSMPSQLVVKAISYGMQAKIDSSKGWVSRDHVVTTTASVRDTWVFWTTAHAWMEANA